MLTLDTKQISQGQTTSQNSQIGRVSIKQDSDPSRKRDEQKRSEKNNPLEQLLFSVLEGETRLLESLLDILKTEKSVLGSHDLETLEKTIQEKAHVVSALERETQKRFECVSKFGVTPNNADWLEQLTPHLLDQTHFLISYDYIVSLTNQCRDLNKNNGLLINHREGLTSKVINVLRTNSAPDVYSDSGQSESGGESRVIGKA